MNTSKYIIWEKWRDPFLGYDDNEIDIDNVNLHNSINTNNIEPESEEDEDYHGLFENKNNFHKRKDMPVRAIATPMGIIPYNEYTASSSIFNFWIGHTNFDIDHYSAIKIENTIGVETLDIFTRYRFRIGIGKAFEDREVMKLIESNICQHQ